MLKPAPGKFPKWATVAAVCLLAVAACRGRAALPEQPAGVGGPPSITAEISGRYEGIGKTQSHGDLPIAIDLVSAGGTISGVMHTPLGDFDLTHGSRTGERLTLVVESYDDEGSITATVSGDQLSGELIGFGEKARLELRRTGPPRPPVRAVLSLSKEAWREDLRFLATELPRRHKNAFHRVTRERFEQAVAELDSRIPSLPDARVVMEMSRIVASIGDGHTNLGWHELFPRVPLRFFWFGKELRVIQAGRRFRRALGARVVKIGSATAGEAYRKDQPYISQGETEGFVRAANAANMTCPAHLRGLGLTRDPKHARYALLDDRGTRFSLDVSALAPGEPVEWVDAARKKPLERQSPEEPLWRRYLPRAQTLYFNFSSYPRRRAFGAFSRDLFDFIDHHPIQRVVVDLRQNGGGDFNRGREYILSGFKQRPAFARRGRLFVIIGRGTFSAGMVNAADFRDQMNAILVGEPTGQRPNSYSENRGFSLPNSHLNVSYSTEYYKIQEKDTAGIIPHKRIDPDWTSYAKGRDRALEWILAQPLGKTRRRRSPRRPAG